MENQQQNKGGCGCCMPILVIFLIFFILIMALTIQGYRELMGMDETTAPAQTEPGAKAAPAIKQDGHVYNILLVGHDEREGESGRRSDSMILCTVDCVSRKVVLTSFLRDLWVYIPGQGEDRLNAAYSLGGIKLLSRTLRHNFGVTIDATVEMSFEQFREVIDLFGGVCIELSKKEADHLGGGLKEGANLLTSAQALDYARIRKLDSDFGRTDRQRKVISALLAEMKDMTAEEMATLMRRIPELVNTDIGALDLWGWSLSTLPVLSKMEIVTQHIPAVGAYADQTIGKKQVLVPDLEKNIEILKDTIGS